MSSIRKSGAALLALLLLLFCSPCWSNDKTSGPPGKVDRIVVEKSARTMTLMRDGKVLKTYKVALSREPVGAKERTGDHKVPEGNMGKHGETWGNMGTDGTFSDILPN